MQMRHDACPCEVKSLMNKVFQHGPPGLGEQLKVRGGGQGFPKNRQLDRFLVAYPSPSSPKFLNPPLAKLRFCYQGEGTAFNLPGLN